MRFERILFRLDAALMTMVETPFFLRKADGLIAEEEAGAVDCIVAANPGAGDVIPEPSGVRKLRWAAVAKERAVKAHASGRHQ
jgi:hypothetical protein